MNNKCLTDYEYPSWNKPKVIYWFISKETDNHGNALYVWGFDNYPDAQNYVDIFGGHIEVTRPDKQLELF